MTREHFAMIVYIVIFRMEVGDAPQIATSCTGGTFTEGGAGNITFYFLMNVKTVEAPFTIYYNAGNGSPSVRLVSCHWQNDKVKCAYVNNSNFHLNEDSISTTAVLTISQMTTDHAGEYYWQIRSSEEKIQPCRVIVQERLEGEAPGSITNNSMKMMFCNWTTDDKLHCVEEDHSLCVDRKYEALFQVPSNATGARLRCKTTAVVNQYECSLQGKQECEFVLYVVVPSLVVTLVIVVFVLIFRAIDRRCSSKSQQYKAGNVNDYLQMKMLPPESDVENLSN